MRKPTFTIEKKLHAQGFSLIAGVDEVGCGPLAGPVVAAAVILPLNCQIKGLDDSKKLLPRKREELCHEIKSKALAISVSRVSHRIIDKINIHQANLLALKIAVEKLAIQPDYILIDGARNYIDLSIPQRSFNYGDAKCASIAAASIIAKVTRDRLMLQYHQKYPRYKFDRHKGYGTKLHIAMIVKYGRCPIHRKSFVFSA